MDKKNYNIDEEIQKTLDSVDAIQRVEGNPFLHTRLQERLKSNQKSSIGNRNVLSPVWQFSLVAFLIFANGYVLLESGYFNSTNEATIDDFATEYELTPNEDDTELAFYND